MINAFNNDKSYDQFIREQLAGDELDDATHETLIATGFLRLGIWDDEPTDFAYRVILVGSDRQRRFTIQVNLHPARFCRW